MSVVATEILNAYIGFEYDNETGNYYCRARFYSPTSSRFLSEEPTGIDGPNLYWYALNNPINIVDPTGEYGVFGSFVGAVAGGIGGYITSSSIKGAVIGAAAGAAVGFIAPTASTKAGAAAAAFASGFGGSIAGQAVGNYVVGRGAFSNISIPAALGAGVGAGAAAALGSGAIASAFYNRSLGGGIQGVVEGAFTGLGELGGSSVGNLFSTPGAFSPLSGQFCPER